MAHVASCQNIHSRIILSSQEHLLTLSTHQTQIKPWLTHLRAWYLSEEVSGPALADLEVWRALPSRGTLTGLYIYIYTYIYIYIYTHTLIFLFICLFTCMYRHIYTYYSKNGRSYSLGTGQTSGRYHEGGLKVGLELLVWFGGTFEVFDTYYSKVGNLRQEQYGPYSTRLEVVCGCMLAACST